MPAQNGLHTQSAKRTTWKYITKAVVRFFYISIFLLAAQQSCSNAVSDAYKPGNERKGYTPKPALGFTSKILFVFQVWLVLVHTHTNLTVFRR